MKKVFLPILLLTILTSAGFAQSNARLPLDLVQDAKKLSSTFKSVDLLQLDTKTKGETIKIEEDISKYSLFDINWDQLSSIQKDQPATISLELPVNFTNSITLELVKVDIFTSDFKVTRGYDDSELDVDTGVHYRGIIKGDDRSIAAISILDGEITGLISNDEGNIVLGRLQDPVAKGKHIAYDDLNVFTRREFSCAMPDDGIGYKRKDLEYKWGGARAVGDCIRLYMEADYDIYQDKGTGTAGFVSALMNEVITIYANESIASVVSQIVVWDTPSPYASTSSSGMLSDFQNNLGSFNGDLGQLLSYQASGGIAAGFSGLCNSNSDNSLCFSSIQSSFANVPTYSWSVMVVTHEFGHLWGSRHTHACVWNGNNTAIDGCAGSTEGSCALPGNPSQGGTIMSYCHLQSVGINFNEGFGPQPGNVIRNSVANANCTAACGPASCEDGIQNQDETGVDCGGVCPVCPTCDDGIQNGEELGVDCGGPDCAPCPCNGQDVTLTLVLDNYPQETSWTITAGGLTYASGSSYSGAGSTVVEVNCLNDGCYDFNIFDSYGDGICCAYGNGSYVLTDASGNTLASGGSFGSSETTNFCLSTTPSLSVSIAEQMNVSCNGGSDGSVTAATTNGNSPYNYNWSNGGSSATIAGLTAGSYTVTVTDANNNTGTATAIISEPSPLSVTATGTDASCAGANDGSVSAIASGGTGSISYNWSGPNSYTATGSSLSNLAAGTYTVTATDANTCTATDAVTIDEISPGTACDDNNACTIDDTYDSNCNCVGTFEDTDGDGVCDTDDVCPGFDDNIDTDGDGTPDGCDNSNCTPVTNNFPTASLTHSGTGSSSTSLSYAQVQNDISFTISDLNAVTNGQPSRRYVEEVTVTYDDGTGSNIPVGTYSGINGNTASINISGSVVSVTVTLQDAYDGNAPGLLSVDLGTVSSCDTGVGCPDDDNDGVCNAVDVCPGFDDNMDTDGDGIPDGCDNSNCTVVTNSFPNDPLTHSGAGSSSTTLSYALVQQDVSFTISGLDAVTNGQRQRRHIDEAVVTYDDGTGSSIAVGTYSGANGSTAEVSIPGDVVSITVSLQDGYDGNSSQLLSIDFSEVSSCNANTGLPASNLINTGTSSSVKSNMKLFPNPVMQELTVQFELLETTNVTLLITDVNGRTLAERQMNLEQGRQEAKLEVSGLAEGIYLLHLQSKKQTSTKKFVIMR